MSNIKYTSDGKKVVVIGSLNSVDKIVQEIFIIDGAEIPSGEHFVVKSLHDAPAVSWQQKEIDRIKKEYETAKATIQKETEQYQKQQWQLSKEFREKTRYIRSVMNNISVGVFDSVSAFLCGDITHIVRLNGSSSDIEEFKHRFSDANEDRLRLISLFGKDDGTLTWKINKYSDGSGYYETIFPCKSYEEAVVILKDHLKELCKESIHDSLYATAKKWGVDIPPSVLEVYKKQQEDYYVKRLKEIEDNKEKYQLLLEKTKEICQ